VEPETPISDDLVARIENGVAAVPWITALLWDGRRIWFRAIDVETVSEAKRGEDNPNVVTVIVLASGRELHLSSPAHEVVAVL